jgi:hypothetical protein
MPRKTWRAALAAYASPSTLVLLLLGFAAGLPYMLVFSTLSVWLREAGVARETIGYASLIGLAYAFKWVWSPLLDQWRLPLLGKLGRRRSWLVLAQSLVILGLIGMGFCDPQKHLSWLIAIAVIVAFASATQDIAVDAYRLEIADDSRQAALAASYMSGYRIAALLATAGALFFAEGFGSTGFNYQHSAWLGTYVLFGVLMIPALLTTLFMREPDVPLRTQLQAGRYSFAHQLVSVFVLIVLLVSVPAMFTQLFNTDFESEQGHDQAEDLADPGDLILGEALVDIEHVGHHAHHRVGHAIGSNQPEQQQRLPAVAQDKVIDRREHRRQAAAAHGRQAQHGQRDIEDGPQERAVVHQQVPQAHAVEQDALKISIEKLGEHGRKNTCPG